MPEQNDKSSWFWPLFFGGISAIIAFVVERTADRVTSWPIVEYELTTEPIVVPGRSATHRATISVINLAADKRVTDLKIALRAADPGQGNMAFLVDGSQVLKTEIIAVPPATPATSNNSEIIAIPPATPATSINPNVSPVPREIQFSLPPIEPKSEFLLVTYYTGADRPIVARVSESSTPHVFQFIEPNEYTFLIRHEIKLLGVAAAIAAVAGIVGIVLMFRRKAAGAKSRKTANAKSLKAAGAKIRKTAGAKIRPDQTGTLSTGVQGSQPAGQTLLGQTPAATVAERPAPSQGATTGSETTEGPRPTRGIP